MRCYVLMQDEMPIAFQAAIQWGIAVVLNETGYDLPFSEYSPGIVIHFRVLEDFIAHDTPRFVDFGPGDYDFKQFFGSRHTYSGRVLVVRRSWWPMITSGLDQFRCEVHQVLRDYLRNLGMFHKIKTMYHNLAGFIRF